MCHDFSYDEVSIDDEKTEAEEKPEFLNEESATETELVTDGGDEE